jgi:hypothetical protein
MNNKRLWFKAKRFGWGWYPCTWQGVLITLAFCGGILLIDLHALHVTEATTNNTATFLWNYFPPLTVLSAIMIWICYKTGEKPKWRWG